MRNFSALLITTILSLFLSSAVAQPSDSASWTATVQNEFRVIPNITYRRANGVELNRETSFMR